MYSSSYCCSQIFTFVVVLVLKETKGKYKQDDILTVLFLAYKEIAIDLAT